jgi:hypothetical protein
MATVQETAEHAIRAGLSDLQVLRRVLEVHPGANTSTEAIRWYRARLGRAVEAPRAAEPATPAGRAIDSLLREGLPDYIVFRRTGAVSLASVRAYRSRLIGRGEDVPTSPEARRYWEALYGATRAGSGERRSDDPRNGLETGSLRAAE